MTMTVAIKARGTMGDMFSKVVDKFEGNPKIVIADKSRAGERDLALTAPTAPVPPRPWECAPPESRRARRRIPQSEANAIAARS